MKTEKNGSYRLALCALFAALSYAVFTFLQIKIPVGADMTSIHLGNAVVVLAAFDYIFALKSGNLYAEGAPEKIISEKLIKDVYGLDNQVIIDPSSNAPMVVPIGKHQKSFS